MSKPGRQARRAPFRHNWLGTRFKRAKREGRLGPRTRAMKRARNVRPPLDAGAE